MDNFKFDQFSLAGSLLESLILDKFLLTGFKTITYHEVFQSGNLIFAIIARMLCGT